MGKAVAKATKKYIKKGGLKREVSRRPIQKKLNEEKINKVNKAISYSMSTK
jgi:hypothetical protein